MPFSISAYAQPETPNMLLRKEMANDLQPMFSSFVSYGMAYFIDP